MIPFIFSHIGIFFAYHTTFYSSFSPAFSSSVNIANEGNIPQLESTLARNTFQKHIQVHNFGSQN